MLRNISRRAPELISSNVDATLNPYLSQARKNLREIYTPKTRLLPANDDEAEKSRPDIDSSYTPPILRDKKSKKLLKKYSQINRTVTTPQSLPDESRHEENADGNESSTPEKYFKVPNRKTKPKNESLSIESSSNIYSEEPTEEPESEWNVQNSSVSPQLNNNNSHNVFNVNNLNNLNFPSDTNTIQLLSRYNRMPRPFSVLQAPDSAVVGIPYRKPTPSPASFNRQQVVRSSANILPLIVPTETLFDAPAARRYVPIKYVQHPKPEGDSTTIVNTEASPVTSPAGERTTFINYDVPYTDVIGITKSPVSDQRRISSDYHATTETPTKQIIARTDSARSIHVPSQTSYTLQQDKDPQVVRKNEFLPRITAYNNPDDEKSKLNANAELALYNKFASLYSVPNVLNVPKAVTQNYQNFQQPVQPLHPVTSQYVSTPSYATLKPISPPMLKIRPIAPTKPALAPYYDSGLFVSQRTEGKELNDDKKNAENVEIKEPSASDVDESTEAADSKNNFENHKVQINHGASKSHKTLNEQRKKKNHEEEDTEDHYQQPKRNYDYQDKYYEYDKNNKDDKNDDKREKYNVRYEDNKDEEEEADETQGDEYVNIEKSEDKRNHGYQYNKHKYDKDDSEEKEREKQRDDRKKYDKEKNRRDETDDHETDVKHKFISINKYFDGPRYSDYETREPNEKYRDRKKLARDKKDRDEDSEDESFAEDQLVARRSKDERARRQREEYEKKQNKDKTTQKRKHHHHQIIPRRDSHEQYGESNPKHVREEYRQHVQGDAPRHDSENANEKTRDHEHGETQEHSETHKHEEHHEKKKDGGNHKFEEGGGSEHKEEHHGHEEDKGHKVNYSDIAFLSRHRIYINFANNTFLYRVIKSGTSMKRPTRDITIKNMPARSTMRRTARRRSTRRRAGSTKSIMRAKRARRQQSLAKRANTIKDTVRMASTRCTKR